eukprot:COSAG05_NODE_2328_length_3230_cov_2.151070_4_plen_292_part_00
MAGRHSARAPVRLGLLFAVGALRQVSSQHFCAPHNFTAITGIVAGGEQPCSAAALAAGSSCSVMCATGYFDASGNATISCPADASAGAAAAIDLVCLSCTPQDGCADSTGNCSTAIPTKLACAAAKYGHYVADDGVVTVATCDSGEILVELESGNSGSGSWDDFENVTGNTSQPSCECHSGFAGGGSWISGPTYPGCFAVAHVMATSHSGAFLTARARNAAQLAAAQRLVLEQAGKRLEVLAGAAQRHAAMEEHRASEIARAEAEVLARRPPLELPAECSLTPEEIILLGR